jgi:hypothetical protein
MSSDSTQTHGDSPTPGAVTAPRLAVLPSPLLGPAGYLPLAEALRERGIATVVASLPAGEVMPAGVLHTFGAMAAHHQATVLVAHSNAGYYAPSLATWLGLAVVYLDAALPPAGVAETLLAPASFAEHLHTLPLTGGRLPPWPAWWDRAEVASLFPSEEWLDRVTREAPRLAPDYFTTRLSVPSGWEARPAAYLGFGDTYAEELSFAERAGWLVRREEGHHLAHLADPDRVADLVLDLVNALTAPR